MSVEDRRDVEASKLHRLTNSRRLRSHNHQENTKERMVSVRQLEVLPGKEEQ